MRRGLTPEAVGDALSDDAEGSIKAVMVVHNETSTGVTTDIESIGRVMSESGHPAMLFVDAVSSLAVTDLRHDEWGIDVTLTGSQKGLMLPPGLAMLAIGPRRGERAGEPSPLVLAMGRPDQLQPAGLLPLHAGHQPPVRTGGGARVARRGGPGRRLRPARPIRAGHASRGRELGARLLRGRVRGVELGGDRGARARRRGRGLAEGADSRPLRHVAGDGARRAQGEGLPDRPPGLPQRALARRSRASRWGCGSPAPPTSGAASPRPWTC